MPTTLDQNTVATILPGSWRVGATNIVSWLDGERSNVMFRFDVQNENPLSIAEHQSFTTADGKDRVISIYSEWVDGVFRSKGRGLLKTGATRWRMGGVSADHAVMILRVATVRGGQDGLLVLVRDGDDHEELRSRIASSAADLGIGPEDFASLSWL